MNIQTLSSDDTVSSDNAKTQAIPLGQKFAFGAGMLANHMFPAALGVFMVIVVLVVVSEKDVLIWQEDPKSFFASE
mgnify:CR=1 FL=1